MMSIFGPRACSTISAATSTLDRSTLDRSSALDLTSAPSTSRTGVRATDEPGSPSIFSILTRSPSATLYCFPPVLTIAYIEGYRSEERRVGKECSVGRGEGARRRRAGVGRG